MKPKSVSGLVYKVVDLDETIKFYEGLGFRVDKNDGRIATVYVNWFFMEFHLANGTDESPKSGPIVMVSVEAEEFFNSAIKAGYKPETELQKTVNGRREFYLRDPNGYLLAFFEKK